MEDEILKFKLTGHEFVQEQYNLRYLIDSVNTFQKLLDYSYSTIIGKNKFREEHKKHFKVYMKNVRDGSFETDLLIHVSTISASLLNDVSSNHPRDIWKLAKESFKYLKAVYENAAKGKRVHVEINNSPNTNVVTDSTNVKIEANEEIAETAKKVKGTLSEFSKKMAHADGIDGFHVMDNDNNQEPLSFTREDINIFKNESIVHDTSIDVIGIYTTANSKTKKGKIRISENVLTEDIELHKGEYNFNFINKNIDENSFREGFIKERTYYAQPKIQFNIELLKYEVIGLNIIDIKR